MLCDSVLMSAGQYTGTCNVMCAWHASMHEAGLIRYCTIAWSAGQQAEHMSVHIEKDNAMPAI